MSDFPLELLTIHFPGLFRCGCGEKLRVPPLADPGHREKMWAIHLNEVLRVEGWVTAETYAISGRVSTMYQNRVKDLGKVLMDAKGLVREIDPALAVRIGEALKKAGFDD